MKKLMICSSFAILLFAVGGCCNAPEIVVEPVIIAKYAPGLKADGKMSDPAWKKAVPYRLIPHRRHQKSPEKMAAAVEKTRWWNDVTGRVLYDKTNIYIGFEVKNDDIRALRPEDQTLLWRWGDTMEVFLKPVGKNSFAEFYTTPAGNKTSIIFPSRSFQGTALLEVQKLMPGLEVYSSIDGTLNDGSDTDRGWTSVMVIPRKKLAEVLGVENSAGTEWTMLLAGYAYSANQIFPSNFSWPELPVLNYLLTEYYAKLVFEAPGK